MRTTIYIRKENEHIWKDIAFPGAWVNQMLSELRKEGKHVPGSGKKNPSLEVVPTEDWGA